MPMKNVDHVIVDLGLAPFDQDWGIICADARRLNEFVDYFLSHFKALDESTQVQVMELVLASADDAIKEESSSSDEIVAQVDRALRCGGSGPCYLSILEYWRGYWSGDQYGNVGRPALYHALDRRLMGGSGTTREQRET
jgi:hypothetical protein